MLWPAVRSRQVVGTSATRRPASVALTVSSRASSKPAVLSIVDRVEEPARVELEVVRRVVGRDAAEPVERQAGGPAQQPLERAARRPGARRACSATPTTTSAPSRARATIGSTTCGSSEPSAIEIRTYGAVRRGDPRLHRVEDAAAEVVAMAADRRQLGVQALDDRDGRVLVEVVDDEDLVRRRDRGGQRRGGRARPPRPPCRRA